MPDYTPPPGGGGGGVPMSLAVRLATTEPTALSGHPQVDSVNPNDGDLILVKDQEELSENGVYTKLEAGWEKTDDDLYPGMLIVVTEGATQHDTVWTLSSDDPDGINPEFSLAGGLGSAEGVLLAANNLSDLEDIVEAKSNLSLGTAAGYNAGTGEGELAPLSTGGKFDLALMPSGLATDAEAATAASTAAAAAVTTHEAAGDPHPGYTTTAESNSAIAAAVAAHEADATAAHAASAISFSPTGTIAATTVQAAIAEVASEAAGAPTTSKYVTGAADAGLSNEIALPFLQFSPYAPGIWQPAASPSAKDDDFDDSAVDAKWVWDNQGSATASETDPVGWLTLSLPAQSGNNHRSLEQATPAGDWTIISLIGMESRCATNGGFGGLSVRNSSTNARRVLAMDYEGQAVGASSWSSATGFITGIGTTLVSVQLSRRFMKISWTNATSTLQYFISDDGTNWARIASDTLAGVDRFGIFANDKLNVAGATKLRAKFFRVT